MFSKDKSVFATVTTKLFTEDDIANVVITALEGGVGYWMCLDIDPEQEVAYKEKYPDLAYTERVTKMLLDGKTVASVDAEDWEVRHPDLTLKKLQKGLELFMINKDRSRDLADWDSLDCDTIFQYALFGELIYG
jgi:hypothetical protein